MKYKVTIHQNIKYNETLVGTFDDLAEVGQFIDTVLGHFEKVGVEIEVVMEEETNAD